MMRKLVLLLCAAAAYAVGFQPTWMLRDSVLAAAGSPAYQGVWILIPHLFLYSTLSALVCLALWLALIGAKWLSPMPFAFSRGVIIWGLIAGVVTALASFAYFAIQMPDAIHAARLNPWIAGANIFSNFYEEFIFRGFLLAALTAVFGFWPAAVLSSIAFAGVHTQYPLDLRALIAASAILWCWIVRRTKSVWSAYIAHMTLDWIVDPFA
jgi:membrane protease YdiL (CAAX protease family)